MIQFLKNTQKVESVNQTIRRALPKRLTFPCCFSSRAHSAVFNINNGPGESLVRLCEETGCPMSKNIQAAAALLKKQSMSEKEKSRDKSQKKEVRQKAKKTEIVSNI